VLAVSCREMVGTVSSELKYRDRLLLGHC